STRAPTSCLGGAFALCGHDGDGRDTGKAERALKTVQRRVARRKRGEPHATRSMWVQGPQERGPAGTTSTSVRLTPVCCACARVDLAGPRSPGAAANASWGRAGPWRLTCWGPGAFPEQLREASGAMSIAHDGYHQQAGVFPHSNRYFLGKRRA